MIISIQWATDPPADFVNYEINSNKDFEQLPFRGLPLGGVNDQQGYINMLNIEGTGFTGDHYGLSLTDEHLYVGIWNDDPDDWLAVPFGHLYIYNIVSDQHIPDFGKSSVKILQHDQYADREVLKKLFDDGEWAQQWYEDAKLKPWSEFPDFKYTWHGIWLNDDLYQEHAAIRSPRYRND